MNSFKCTDAILDLSDPEHPREPEWPEVDFIVGNPPFLGDKMMRGELGDKYVEALRGFYKDRVPGGADFCCYWFELARRQIEAHGCKRAGLLATQAIRQPLNRRVLERIKQTGDIFFAVSDREWVLDGANVHVSMIGFDGGAETDRRLDSKPVRSIHANLVARELDLTKARRLVQSAGCAFIGTTKKGPFDVPEPKALTWLGQPNAHGRPNSDVLMPLLNSRDVTSRTAQRWVVDFAEMTEQDAALYEQPFAYVRTHVLPLRIEHRESVQRNLWWRLARPCPDMKIALRSLGRFLVTPTTSKHRIFAWLAPSSLPDHKLVAFGTSSDVWFGILHSAVHEAWALAMGSQLRERASGFTYTPTTCFETFPFPDPSEVQHAAIAFAAKELNGLRENWLNPPEWTCEEILEFPGSTKGPWARYVSDPNAGGLGTARFRRLVPKDAACATKLAKRTLTNLYNARPDWLANAHRKLDEAVFAAYGWPSTLGDDEILGRLLELNLARSAGSAPAPSESAE